MADEQPGNEFRLKLHKGKKSSTSSLQENHESSHANDATDLLHTPVMVTETIEMLQPQNHHVIIDMTFGAGGHTREIIRQAPQCRVIALDRDPVAYGLAKRMAAEHSSGQISPLLGKFTDLPNLLKKIDVAGDSIDGVLMDVGASSMQFDSPHRGFSLSRDGPLDMRMDGEGFSDEMTAADVVNHLDEKDLCQVIRKYGEDRRASDIARAIVEARCVHGKITRTKQLADIVSRAFSCDHHHDSIHRRSHVATQTFQALRILVNDELNELSNAIEISHHFLKPKGRCVVLTFHSLEDRIVKRHFHGINIDDEIRTSTLSGKYQSASLSEKYRSYNKVHTLSEVEDVMAKLWDPIHKNVVSLEYKERLKHPRGRSAKLRGAVKVGSSVGGVCN